MARALEAYDNPPVEDVLTLAEQCRADFPDEKEVVPHIALPDCGVTEASIVHEDGLTLAVQRVVTRKCLNAFSSALRFNRANDVTIQQSLTPLDCTLPTYNLIANDYLPRNRPTIADVLWLHDNCKRYNFWAGELSQQ